MKTLNIVNGPQNVSAIIQGCMRMPALSKEDAANVIRTAYDCGINFFDHATCYGNGEAEERFSQALPLTGIKREDIYIQSKCGLCFDRNEFDWTKENILSSVDDSLRRLNVEYLDALLLHRPDLHLIRKRSQRLLIHLKEKERLDFSGSVTLCQCKSSC